jgi:hypothetical protein
MFHGRRASACKYSCEPSHPTCDADSSGSDALESSLLECQIYAKHKVGRDDFIGGTKDAIESLLTEGAAGGLFWSHVEPLSLIRISYQLSLGSCANMPPMGVDTIQETSSNFPLQLFPNTLWKKPLHGRLWILPV